jgi:ATP-binding cassette, subfamily B, multidrug efflux pump
VAFKWIWNELKGYRLRMALGLFIVLVCSALTMVNPYISGTIVDQVILGKKYQLLMRLMAIMAGAALIRQLLRYSFQMVFENISQTLLFNIRVQMYTKLQALEFNFFDKTRTGDIMNKLTGDTDMVRHFVAWVIYNIFENMMTFLFAVTFLFSINWRLTLIMLPMVFLSGYFNIRLAKNVKPTFFAIREQLSRLNSVVQENISGNRVIKAFAKENYEIEKFTKENQAYKQRNIASAKVWEKYLPVLDSIAGTLVVVVILSGGIMVIHGSLTLGQLVAFNSFIWALNNPMRMSGWLINDMQRFATSGEKIIELLKTEPQIKNPMLPVNKGKLAGQIEFKKVCFSYGEEEVLEDINLKVEPGQTVAIIGPTGSGKSTLINLISRFYDCTSGELLIDGMNIRDINIKDLRENIAHAMQDIFLFSDTIEGNIAYGVPDASQREIEWAAEAAKVTEFINNFPERYDTIIGERGVGLSGGQKQRIALARALLKNPTLLILDDTTSSVDMETEYEIQQALNNTNQKRTTLIIAHRISSVKNADQIVVLDNGRILEQGKHEELLRKKGYYYSVFVNQYGDFDNLHSTEVS